LAYHENAAATVRATMALLSASPVPRVGGDRKSAAFQKHHESSNGNGNGLPTIERAAVAMDEKRRRALWRARKAKYRAGTKPGKKQKKRKSPGDLAKYLAQRQRTAEALAKFDLKDPFIPVELGVNVRHMGPYVRRGYLKRKGGGYIRTAKPFYINPKDAEQTAEK